MKRLLPGRVELAIFAVMAVIAGIMVATSAHHDTMLFFVTMPIFLVASLLGFRRNLMLRQVARVKVSEGIEMQNISSQDSGPRLRN